MKQLNNTQIVENINREHAQLMPEMFNAIVGMGAATHDELLMIYRIPPVFPKGLKEGFFYDIYHLSSHRRQTLVESIRSRHGTWRVNIFGQNIAEILESAQPVMLGFVITTLYRTPRVYRHVDRDGWWMITEADSVDAARLASVDMYKNMMADKL